MKPIQALRLAASAALRQKSELRLSARSLCSIPPSDDDDGKPHQLYPHPVSGSEGTFTTVEPASIVSTKQRIPAREHSAEQQAPLTEPLPK